MVERKETGRTARADEFYGFPEGYCRDYLLDTLWAKQIEILEKLHTPPYRVLVRSGHSTGKTFLGGRLANWHFDTFPQSQTIITAPDQRSVEDLMFAEVRKSRRDKKFLAPKAPICFEHENHWIKGYTANKGESFAGRHAEHMMFLFDESTGLHPIYFEVTKGMYIPGQHYWICFYNPTDSGSQVYHEESSGTWHIVDISQLEHPNVMAHLEGKDPPFPGAVTYEQAVGLLDDYGSRLPADAPPEDGEVSLGNIRWSPGPIADIRVLGRWPRTGAKTVWSDALWKRMDALRVDLNPAWRVQGGVDVAAYGTDDTVIMFRQGRCIIHCERHNGWGPRQTTIRVKQLCHQFHGPHEPMKVPVLVDAPGVGAGVWDWGEGYNFIPVNPASVSTDETKYYNMRTELWFRAREHAEADLLDISRMGLQDRNRLRVELLTPTYGLTPDDRLRVEPKPETHNKIGRSPDMADAFNLVANWQWG